MTDPIEPTITAFACAYCGYAAADLAGSLRLEHPPTVRVVKLPCSGRADPVMLLRTLQAGADAVAVIGCRLGDCHFMEGNCRGKAVVRYARELLDEVGIEPERLEYFHVAASQAQRWVSVVEEMDRRARQLGPMPARSVAAEPRPEQQKGTRGKSQRPVAPGEPRAEAP